MKSHKITFRISSPVLDTVGNAIVRAPSFTRNDVLVSRARRIVLKGLLPGIRKDTTLEVLHIEKDWSA